MSRSMNDYNYVRDDVYYCECCGKFYNRKTHLTVDIPLTDLPADFAIEVMVDRQNSIAGRRKRHKRRYSWLNEM